MDRIEPSFFSSFAFNPNKNEENANPPNEYRTHATNPNSNDMKNEENTSDAAKEKQVECAKLPATNSSKLDDTDKVIRNTPQINMEKEEWWQTYRVPPNHNGTVLLEYSYVPPVKKNV